ncbi:hypothetical protein LZ31DRAFT_561543 [Colletotrichum somersetense]|nr:hypothetical protein LZ31DRAFT_561543 [Colletotrichum somersetense]
MKLSVYGVTAALAITAVTAKSCQTPLGTGTCTGVICQVTTTSNDCNGSADASCSTSVGTGTCTGVGAICKVTTTSNDCP